MRKVMNLTFSSSITNLCEVNKSFDAGVIRIAYVGDNRNKTNISKAAFEKALPSIYNCPVVCNYDIETDTLGGHDLEVVVGSDGGLKVINATNPIGVVPESAKTWFENYTGDDGIEREYLYAEALFWKRQAAYQKIKTDGITNQSMEIAVKAGKSVNGIYQIEDFEFTAFTAIGVEPCFEDASIEIFSKQSFKDQLSEMMEDLKASFSLVSTPSGEDIHPHIFMKGESATLEDKFELAAKYGIDVESLDFKLEDFTLEELEEKFEAMKASEDVSSEEENTEVFAEAEPEGEQPQEVVPEGENFELVSNIRKEIGRELRAHPVKDRWGGDTWFYLLDFDQEAKLLYVEDPVDYLPYSLGYSFDNDKVVIDYGSKKRVKAVYVEFVESEGFEPEPNHFFEVVDQKIADLEKIQAEYQELATNFAAAEEELTSLRDFKANAESAAAEEARNEIFSRFEDLADVDAFKELKGIADQLDLETLEEKCFAIRGRQGAAMQFSLEEAAPKIKFKKHSVSPKPYGGIVERYLGEDE